MTESPIDTAPGMHVVDNVLIVQAPDAYDDATLCSLRKNVLQRVYAHKLRAVVLDVSTIVMLDSVSYGLLADLARTVRLLGARIVVAGFQPGAVAALIDLDVDAGGVMAVRDVAEGLELLRPPKVVEQEEIEEEPLSENDEDTEPDADPDTEAGGEKAALDEKQETATSQNRESHEHRTNQP